ncbi:enoyl-CoA hydratase/isomerase family protein [Microbispora hainanensis]|uniref:Enoyl-CoA hydratase/isomerase family protein n=1 Tax=Microbispora hainanensis TaxID=568844 RepID=A0A544YNZ4_9ACTN|nr:enoyl-CoA hydratase/isomerase family protein [Microbispora hainanensis]TQS18437.1 enoyl-CoA hydratase/isomerase family protein [Microbispora hainanensis]
MAEAAMGGNLEHAPGTGEGSDVSTISAAAPAEVGLRFEVDGEIATVTLDRPDKRNAQTFATWSALARIGETLPEQVRVVVVRGEGPSFSAGIDLRMFTPEGVPGQESFTSAAALGDSEFEQRIAEAQKGFLWLRRPEIVSIAAVQGHAIGAGFQLALACDLRVVADDVKFCMKEPALGLVPDLTGTKPLADIVGVPRAIEMCLTARTVGAAEAVRLGLAEIAVPTSELAQAVQDLAAALLATDRAAAIATKRLLQAAPGRTLEEQAAAERIEQVARIRALFGTN